MKTKLSYRQHAKRRHAFHVLYFLKNEPENLAAMKKDAKSKWKAVANEAKNMLAAIEEGKELRSGKRRFNPILYTPHANEIKQIINP